MNERVVRFGRHGSLCGIFTEPGGAPREQPAVLLLNAGLLHRVGPARLYVRLARALAAQGFPAFRFDFSGFGDSAARRDTLPFQDSAVEETRTAMTWLEEHGLGRHFVLIGLCSGAEIGFKTACVDTRVVGACLINAPRYLHDPDARTLATVKWRSEAGYYWRVAPFKASSWRKALGGRSQYGSWARLAWTWLRNRRRAPDASAASGNGDAAAFEDLRRRRVGLLLLFTTGDWGWDYLRTVLGPEVKGWVGAVTPPRVAFIPSTDHTLTLLASQERVRELTLAWAHALRPGPGWAEPRVERRSSIET